MRLTFELRPALDTSESAESLARRARVVIYRMQQGVDLLVLSAADPALAEEVLRQLAEGSRMPDGAAEGSYP